MEEWVDIKGFDGIYEVSSLGNVRVKERFVTHSRNPSMKIKRKPKTMSPIDHGNGYLYVTLTKDGKRNNRYIHRLVAEAFIDNPDGLPEVDHINRRRDDNCVENLRWTTRQGNIDNSSAVGTRKNHWKKPASGERYVLFRKGKWVVQIQRRDMKVYRQFKTKEEAVCYRDELERMVMENVG